MSNQRLTTPSSDPSATIECVLLEQRRTSWKLSEDETIKAIALMNTDGLTKEEENDPLRVFLYAKGIMHDEKPVVRKGKFDCLLNPDAAEVSAAAREKLRAAKERLRRIVVTGEDSRNLEGGSSLFDQFVLDHPEWGPETSFVTFRDHPYLKDKPHVYKERVQLSGLCYMHAPVILQHYLVAMSTDEPVPMLDMAVYLKKYMKAEQLKKRIWGDEGGTSAYFLESILIQDPPPKFLIRSGEAEMESYLKSFGPALVSGFKVDAAFDSDEWQHLGCQKITSKGFHAMVLVGIRKEGSQDRFLLQNWWMRKPFVEVDGPYLQSVRAYIHFVETPQLRMGDYPTNSMDHVECEQLDCQETFCGERFSRKC